MFKREEFKVMKWSQGLPVHKSMELTLGTGREPDPSRQGERWHVLPPITALADKR